MPPLAATMSCVFQITRGSWTIWPPASFSKKMEARAPRHIRREQSDPRHQRRSSGQSRHQRPRPCPHPRAGPRPPWRRGFGQKGVGNAIGKVLSGSWCTRINSTGAPCRKALDQLHQQLARRTIARIDHEFKARQLATSTKLRTRSTYDWRASACVFRSWPAAPDTTPATLRSALIT